MQKEEKETNLRVCKFYLQGNCRFGKKCRFSHETIEVFLMRHAQSVYNQIVETSEFDSFSPEAKEKYQMNTDLIDCKITSEGEKQIQCLKFPLIIRKYNMRFDLIFVSPLERALKTLHLTLKHHKILAKKVIVIPHLTEVVSKMCDFTSNLQKKKQKYTKFDFSLMDKFSQQRKIFWQDAFIDEQYKTQIIDQQQSGKRYVNILDQIFPTPLEGSRQCLRRTMEGINEIKKICLYEKAQRIFIVSHNRVLKYIMGKDRGGKAESFGNCQIKSTIF